MDESELNRSVDRKVRDWQTKFAIEGDQLNRAKISIHTYAHTFTHKRVRYVVCLYKGVRARRQRSTRRMDEGETRVVTVSSVDQAKY